MARDRHIQLRVSGEEKRRVEENAAACGLSVGEFLRELGLVGRDGFQPFQGGVARQLDSPGVVVVEPAGQGLAAGVDLVERRERRARELSATMPLANARVLAAREIPE